MKFRFLQEVNVPMLQLLNTPEKLRFSAVFREYEIRALATKGLKLACLFRVSVSSKLPAQTQ